MTLWMGRQTHRIYCVESRMLEQTQLTLSALCRTDRKRVRGEAELGDHSQEAKAGTIERNQRLESKDLGRTLMQSALIL
jgi:hypothetical protein